VTIPLGFEEVELGLPPALDDQPERKFRSAHQMDGRAHLPVGRLAVLRQKRECKENCVNLLEQVK